jgi:hypothetical protein
MRSLLALSCLACLLAAAGWGRNVTGTHAAATKGLAPLTLTVTIDFGRDLGQNFGSLLEVKDAAGRVVAGAGFAGAYNTRFRMDRHTLQFFVRPVDAQDRFTTRRLPRPDDHCGLYLFDFDGKLHAFNDGVDRAYRFWDGAADAWRTAGEPAPAPVSSGDGMMRVGSGILRFMGGRADYQGRTILEQPAVGRYHHFYYAEGRLFFYHDIAAPATPSTRIYACPWRPGDAAPIDVARAEAITLAQPGETTFAFGQLGRQVLTVSNMGGVYVFEEGRWRILRDPSPGVSYQVYSMLNYYDRLLLGQYPTGEVWAFDGKSLQRREGWPPRLPGVSASAREAQTLAIYRGELFAGIWPWAEVWRYDRDADRWHSLGRLFTHPAITDKTVHPYEAESVQHGLVLNYWGQRVTSMVPLGDALMLSTSAKGNVRWDAKYDFLTESRRKEYGAGLALTMPGNVAAPVRWKEGPTELQFVLLRDRMLIRQDGREIASAALDPSFVRSLRASTVVWANGVFGPLRGEIIRAGANGLPGGAPFPGRAPTP